MTATLQQIKQAYEDGASIEEIASPDGLGLEIIAVKAALMQCSAKYRKDCGLEAEDEDNLNFTNDQLRAVNQVIYEAATTAETADGQPDWYVRTKNAQYIRDDKKGRKEVVKAVQHNQFNILDINNLLQQARSGASNIKERFLNSTRKDIAI